MGCDTCSCNVYPKISGSGISQRIQRVTNFSGVMVIGESPAAMEATRGELMTGAGAGILKQTLEKVGLPFKEDEVYYTTAIKCAVPKKKGQKFPAVAPLNCREYLLNEIRAVNPKLILVCGAIALQTLTGNGSLKVTELYGRNITSTVTIPGCEVPIIIPIMNPGVLVHKPGDYKPFLSYIQFAATLFGGGAEKDTGVTTWNVCDTEEKCRDLWKKMKAEYTRLKDMNEEMYVSFDIETTGLDYRTAEFLVLGICFEVNITYVIPRAMSYVVHNFISGVPWRCIWQHGKYDKKVLWRRGLGNVSIDEDVLYMHYALDETSAHDLGHMTKVFLNAKEYKYKMNQQWKSVSLDTYPQFFEALCERVAVDVDLTRQLFFVLCDELNKEDNQGLKKLYESLLIPAANFLTRVEQNGIEINDKFLHEMDVKYVALLDKIMKEIEELAAPYWDAGMYRQATGAKSAPMKFNPGSPKQMSWMVFDRLKLHPRIKKGKSTDKDILKSIENPPALINKVLEYRTVQKEHSTYVLGLLDAMDEDKRARTNFTLHVTATGRLSSKEPNVQNQPSANGVGNIRKAFIAPEGKVFAEIDYSGAELRWMAFLSKCPVLSEVFKNGRNLHVETAKSLFGEHFTKQQKMRAKAVNFGIPYGREAKGLADEFNITVEEAEEMLKGWLNTYHGARDYLNWCADQPRLGNYLETPWKRRRRFGVITPASLHAVQNEAKNFPIQSASSDLLLYCAIEMEETLEHWGIKILNLIHDSILLEMPADASIIQAAAQYMNKVMTEAPMKLFNCDIPFKTDFEIGVNWGDVGGTEFDYNVPHCSNEVISIENKDDTITKLSFDEWYKTTWEKERLSRN